MMITSRQLEAFRAVMTHDTVTAAPAGRRSRAARSRVML